MNETSVSSTGLSRYPLVPAMARKHTPYLIAICAICLLFIFIYGRIDYTVAPYDSWDLATYRSMAEAAPGLDETAAKPFAFRILGPYITGLLPLEENTSFYLITICLSVTLLIIFYLFMTYYGIKPLVAALTVLFFMSNKYFFGFTSWDYFQVNDILSLIFILAMFWAMLENKWVLFGSALFLGAITREPVLIMVPVAFFYLVERRLFTSDGWKLILAVTPGVTIFFLLRMILPNSGGDSLVEAFLEHMSKLGSVEAWFRLIVNAFIPLSLLPFVFIRQTVAFFRGNLHLLLYFILVLASSMFASNIERLMAPTFIVFYLLTAQIIEDNFLTHRLILVALSITVVISSMHHSIARWPLPDSTTTTFIAIGTLFAATVLSIIVSTYKTAGPVSKSFIPESD